MIQTVNTEGLSIASPLLHILYQCAVRNRFTFIEKCAEIPLPPWEASASRNSIQVSAYSLPSIRGSYGLHARMIVSEEYMRRIDCHACCPRFSMQGTLYFVRARGPRHGESLRGTAQVAERCNAPYRLIMLRYEYLVSSPFGPSRHMRK